MIVDNDLRRHARPILVTVANMSGILLEIVMGAIERQPDMTARHFINDLVELPVSIRDQTDVLILGAPFVYPPPTICQALWNEFPGLKILVLTPSGDAAVMYWLSVRQQRLETVSVGTLVGSIRHIHRLDLTVDR